MAQPAFLQTDRKESWKTWRYKVMMNWYPMFSGTGGKILFWAADNMEMHVKIKRNFRTYNLVGTIYGGSMFAATDAFYMILLHDIFKGEMVVWDKSASIKFIKPATRPLYAKYLLTEELLATIRQDIAEKGENTYPFKIELLDADGRIHALIERNVYIAEKGFYEQKKGRTQSAKFR